MPTVEVDGATAALLHESRDIINDMIAGRTSFKTLMCPDVNPDGTEVKTVQEAAALMGVSEDVAARAMLEADTLSDEAKLAAFDHLEEKAIRRVRTPAGVRKYGQPIGTIIVRDGLNLTKIKLADKNTFDGAESVEGPGGKRYAMVEDDDGWSAWDESVPDDKFWDKPVVSAKNEEDLLVALDKHLGGGGSKRSSGNRRQMSQQRQAVRDTAPKGPKRRSTDKDTAVRGKMNAREERGKSYVSDYLKRIGGVGPKYDQQWQDYFNSAEGAEWDDLDAFLSGGHEPSSSPLTDRQWQRLRDMLPPKPKSKPKSTGAVTPVGDDDPNDPSVGSSKPNAAKLKHGNKLLDDGYDNPDTWDNYVKGLSDSDREALFAAALDQDDKDVIKAIKKANNVRTSRLAGRGKQPKGEAPKKQGMVAAANVQVGDVVAPTWAQEEPQKVVKIGPVTKTGRCTIYYEGGSRQTYKINERLVNFGSAEGN